MLLACAKSEVTTGNSNTAPAEVKATPATGVGGSTTASNVGDKVGIAECDDFITAYEDCVSNKVPAELRPQLSAGVAQWRTQWKKLAENPQTKATLASVCKTQLETAKQSMKAYNCTF